MKPYTVQEYKKLPYYHLMHNITPLVMGCDIMNCWCHDCKIIVMPDGDNDYIPHDVENFNHGYVKRPALITKSREW